MNKVYYKFISHFEAYSAQVKLSRIVAFYYRMHMEQCN